MNITLSADEKLVKKAREYARKHGTTLNQMIRDYMEKVTGQLSPEEAAAEFRRIAMEHPGNPDPDWKFDRQEIHRRGNW